MSAATIESVAYRAVPTDRVEDPARIPLRARDGSIRAYALIDADDLQKIEKHRWHIAGGYAALTVVPEGMEVVTVEYKINFLSSYQGGEIRATGKVVKAGRRVVVTTAEVVHIDANGKSSPCAVMQQTLAPVPQTY